MGSDDRVRFLAREEIQRAMNSTDLGPGELVEDSGWMERLDDLHRELHFLATKLSEVQDRLSALEDRSISPAVVPDSAPPTRAITGRPTRKGSA